ncbi:tRNA (pseudouridine54-N1)-methyltransferase [Haladaptatus litoreus]|uniref:tRNA (pseudouridine(54)-N(1))-methyltransferase n=1 Tax=Haladaptatus litoreus TaxID=553468 RepID=A0A1N6ZV83_9EURY|nr:tRNA (pseudouridine(54)-N(1))-methyltransferase TrmY [Haladaptatus litoreus]SIR30661.1 tRNA (pseudouridine54-N1)-methyltransferase [Haladaptatus litoreus]
MRQFIVLGHDAPTTPDFSLDDLAGSAGRLDALCRCVNSAFFLSHDFRSDVRLFLVLQDELTIRFEGSELRRLNPDERSTAALIRKALEAKSEAIGHMEAESTPGVHISKRDFEAVLDTAGKNATVIELHEDGSPVVDVEPPENPLFVLSDHGDFTDEEADLLAEQSDQRVRLGSKLLHGNHAMTVAHNYLDTAGYADY